MVAIFLGKFQPPHLGHIRTIISQAKNYDTLIVGITQDSEFIEPKEAKSIFDEILYLHDNINVVLIDGVVELGSEKIPKNIDIVLSGNQNVLNKLSQKGYKTLFVPRTKGIGYSSSQIRALKVQNSTKDYQKPYFELFAINKLKPLEMVFASHLQNLSSMIEKSKSVDKPLIVDINSKVILDGSHRFAYLKSIGCRFAPVLFVDYKDESIFVGNRLKHRFIKDKNHTITKSEVIKNALNEELYEPRTTRHFFPFIKEDYPTSLEKLEPSGSVDIKYLISKTDKKQEIEHNVKFIEEIDEEIAHLNRYIKEEFQTKEYLTKQIKMMKQHSTKYKTEGQS
jgi:cytidyltransferase-like protein